MGLGRVRWMKKGTVWMIRQCLLVQRTVANDYAAELICLVSLEILRAAVFLWTTPFLAAFAIMDCALRRRSALPSLLSSAATWAFLTAVFMADRVVLFRIRLTSDCFARFAADLWLANVHSLLKFK